MLQLAIQPLGLDLPSIRLPERNRYPELAPAIGS